VSETKQKKILVVCGMPGCGKDTILNAFIEQRRREGRVTRWLLSVTTRPSSGNELRGGSQYKFVTAEEFVRLKADGKLLWDLEYAGHQYGTEMNEVENAIASADLTVAILTPQYASVLKSKFPEAVMAVHVWVPSRIAAQRMRERGRETEEQIQKRLIESRHWNIEAERMCMKDGSRAFDVIISNAGPLSAAVEDLINAAWCGRLAW
jgi:guanylate kinase